MELDAFKTHLKLKIDEARGQKSASDIATLLTKKTQSVIHKLKKSLWLEIICCIVFILLFSYVAIVSKYPSLRIYFSVFAVFSVFFLLVLTYLLKRINQLGNASMSIKQNLIAIHTIIKDFVKRYFQFTMSLIPICFIFSGYLGYQDATNGNDIEELDKFNSLFKNNTRVIIFLSVYMVLLTVGIYYFTKWYIKKLYGKYLEQLQTCIDELEQ